MSVRVAQRPPVDPDSSEVGALVVIDTTTGEELDDLDAATVADVIGRHTPPSPPDPDDELDAALAGVDLSTVSDAATRDALGAVIAALRGQAGRQGAAAGRRP